MARSLPVENILPQKVVVDNITHWKNKFSRNLNIWNPTSHKLIQLYFTTLYI